VRYKFFTCDVFTDHRFGGNPLAVLPHAAGLSSRQMQQIAREFNYSETTFVLPPEKGGTRRVRIFTPAREVPFAGHPNIGTAFVLASAQELGEIETAVNIVFEEEAGRVPITVSATADRSFRCELVAPQPLSLEQSASPELVASALTLGLDDISREIHSPRVAGVGLPFLIVELCSLDALARARCNMGAIEQISASGIVPDILLYVRVSDGRDQEIRARMFAPLDGVPEDPATGSANCALAALLSHCDRSENGDFNWRITQGVEMGRPSILYASTRKREGKVTETRIAGDSVLVSEGTIRVD